MQEQGYVYVLINPSLEGLIKVGKTTRDPVSRASELSKATGVPTPFIVAFSDFFHDCTAAENFVHTFLENHNYRLANNREFFNAPLEVVIRAVMEAKNALPNWEATGSENDTESAIIGSYDKKLTADFLLHGMDCFYGTGGKLQDLDEAISYFMKAYKLGNPLGCFWLGRAYREGGKPSDIPLAIKKLKEGATKKVLECYVELAIIYKNLGQWENVEKCWDAYFNAVENNSASVKPVAFGAFSVQYIEQLQLGKMDVNRHIDLLRTLEKPILDRINEVLATAEENTEAHGIYECLLRYIEYILFGKASGPRYDGLVDNFSVVNGCSFGTILTKEHRYLILDTNIIGNQKNLAKKQWVNFGVANNEPGLVAFAHTIIPGKMYKDGEPI